MSQACDDIAAVEPVVHDQEQRVLDQLLAVIQAVKDELPGSRGQGMGATGTKLGVNHPATAQVGEKGNEAEFVGVGVFSPPFLGVRVVKDHRIDVHADPAILLALDVFRLHAHTVPQIDKTYRQLGCELGMQA